MTQDKYPIGSQWKTRGGWRAVILTHDHPSIFVWHEGNDATKWHREKSGKYSNELYDLISPWVEPVKHDVWVNVYNWGNYSVYAYETKEEADKAAGDDRIACLNLKFTEGDGC